MNIRDKVLQLNKYCGMNDEHSYMYDERVDTVSFNIEIPEEEKIKNNIHIVKVFILTGDAGEGKSRLIRNLKNIFNKSGYEIISDFSELQIDEKKELLLDVQRTLKENINKKYFIAANMGVLSESVLKYTPTLFSLLQSPSKELMVINFEKRNFAGDKIFFKKLVKMFYDYDNGTCDNQHCKNYNSCIYKKNIDSLLKNPSIEAIRLLCEASYLMGNHITLRELLSILSLLVTYGNTCKDIENGVQIRNYYDFFDCSEQYDLIKKFVELDPANISNTNIKAQNSSEYRQKIREDFFIEPSLEKLGAKYIDKFYDAIKKLNKAPYFLEYTEAAGLFSDLKVGISKLISKNSTSTEISLFDTPSNVGRGIKTKFTLKEGVALFFCNDEFDIANPNAEIDDKLRNSFYLTYAPKINETIKLKFDYTLFNILMKIKEDYYIEHVSSYGKDYGITDFFRRALNTTEGSYNNMIVTFNDKFSQLPDFQMIKFNKSSLLPGLNNNATKVKISLLGG